MTADDRLVVVCDRRSPRALRELAGLRAAVRETGGDGLDPASRAARRAVRDVAGEAVPPDPDAGSSALRPATLAYGGVAVGIVVPEDRETAERLREVRCGRPDVEELEDVALLGKLGPAAGGWMLIGWQSAANTDAAERSDLRRVLDDAERLGVAVVRDGRQWTKQQRIAAGNRLAEGRRRAQAARTPEEREAM